MVIIMTDQIGYAERKPMLTMALTIATITATARAHV